MPPKQVNKKQDPTIRRVAAIYTLIFLYIEPITALAGFYYAFFSPHDYLQLTHVASAPLASLPLPLATSIVLKQLANLYLFFAINEAFVLRSARQVDGRVNVRVWKAVLAGLLVGDVGHLWTVKELGSSIYWDVLNWNSMAWGNVGIVYAGASLRTAFLLGIGIE